MAVVFHDPLVSPQSTRRRSRCASASSAQPRLLTRAAAREKRIDDTAVLVLRCLCIGAVFFGLALLTALVDCLCAVPERIP